MTNRALVLYLLAAHAACAAAAPPYGAARAQLRNVAAADVKELDALIAQPSSPALLADPRAAAFLKDNQAALESFRQAAELSNEGDLFALKPGTLDSKTPVPQYGEYLDLFKLLILDAKINAARKRQGLVEKDMLAAAGFLVQLSGQRSGAMIASLVQQLCLREAYPVLSESIRNPSSNGAYLKEVSARLARFEGNQDYMRAAFLEDAEKAKGTMRGIATPEAFAKEVEKLPYLNRITARKMLNSDYFSILFGKLDAAADESAQSWIGAFRGNAPERADAFSKKRQGEILSRRQARENWSEWAKFVDGVKGGSETRKKMADGFVDTMLSVPAPDYGKLIPRYHVFLCELNVLRAGLAVVLYRRERRRPPEDLSQLVPAFLSAVPQDSFDGFRAVRYVKTGKKFVIYSFGPDGKDYGGATGLDWAAFSNALNRDPAPSPGNIAFSD